MSDHIIYVLNVKGYTKSGKEMGIRKFKDKTFSWILNTIHQFYFYNIFISKNKIVLDSKKENTKLKCEYLNQIVYLVFQFHNVIMNFHVLSKK